MHREIAASTVVSIAIHAALLVGLVGLRFETAEEASLGVIEAWVVLDDRIDSGSRASAASAVAAAEGAAADPLRPGADYVEQADPVDPVADAAEQSDPLDPVVNAAEQATDPVKSAAKPTEPVAESVEAAAAPVQPKPNPVFGDSAATAGPALAVAIGVPRPALPRLADDIEVQPPDVLESAPSGVTRSSIASSPAPQSRPLVAEVETLTRDADLLSQSGPVAFEHAGQDYSATFRVSPAADDMALDELIVAVSTEQGGDRRTTEMRFKRLAFSHFAQFVDRWDPAVQIHDDEIDGRFHSNSEIYIDTSRGIEPVFHGKVTTSRGISTRSATGHFKRSDVFRGGLETRAGRILLNKDLALQASDESPQRTYRFDQDARITFSADGSYFWQPADSSAPARRRSMPDAMLYLLGADARLFVSGTVNGRVLVHSNETIVIEGDLTYAADPTVQPEADDYLGLVSEKNVEVAEPEVTGPGDLDVHAAIYAERRFVIRRYRIREGATLSILGSVTAGSLTATEPRYRTRLRFDSRLEKVRPPGFPMTDRYELASWDGRWALE